MKNKVAEINKNDVKKVKREIHLKHLYYEGESLENFIESMKGILEKYGMDVKIKTNYFRDDHEESGTVLVCQDDENNGERLARLEKEERDRVLLQKYEEQVRVRLEREKEEEYKKYLELHAKFGK